MKRLVIVALVFAFVVVGGYLLLTTILSPEAQHAALEQRLEEIFGMPVKAGPMRLVLLPRFGVEIGTIEVAQAPEFGTGNVVEVDRVWAKLGFWDYVLERKPVIDQLALQGARIVLVKREDGIWNWATLGGDVTAPRTARRLEPRMVGRQFPAALILLPDVALPDVGTLGIDPRRVEVQRLEVAGATVTLRDLTTEPDSEVVYRGLGLVASISPEGEGYRVRGNVQADSSEAGGEPLTANLPFDSLLVPPMQDRSVWLAEGSFGSGRFGTTNVRLDAVTGSFSLDQTQSLHLDQLRVQLYGGTLEGRFALDLGTRENHFVTSGTLTNVALDPALAARPDLVGAFSGNLTAEFKIEGQLGDFDHTFLTMRGAGILSLTEAQLSSVNILAEIARKGGFEAIQFDEPGTHVERVEGAFRIQEGRLEIANTKLTNMNGYADATVNSGWIDLEVPSSIDLAGEVTVLPPLFEKIGKASALADVVLSAMGSKGKLTIPIAIRGTLDQPTVAVRWEDALLGFLPFGFPQVSRGFEF